MANRRNAKSTMKHLIVTVVMAGLGALFLSSSSSAASGIVLDESNGSPLEGVIVVGRWRGQAPKPVQPDTRCYHSALTKTDSNGKFELSEPRPTSFLMGQRRELALFKPGYVESAGNGAGKPRMKMRKHTQEQRERVIVFKYHLDKAEFGEEAAQSLGAEARRKLRSTAEKAQ